MRTLETLGRAFTGSLIGMAVLDLDGRWLEVNPALCRMLGRSADDLVGRSMIEITHPEDVGDSIGRIRMVSGGKEVTFEKRYVGADGAVIDARVTSAVARDDDGRPRAIFAQIEDVTERKRAERRLRHSEQRFTRAFEDAGVAMSLLSVDYRVLQANPALCLLLGRSEVELEGLDARGFVHPDERAVATARVAELLRGEAESYRREARYLRADGSIAWISVVASLVRGDDGEPLYLLEQLQDVSTEREAKRMADLRLAQQSAVAWLGQRALAEPNLAALFEVAVNMVAATLAATHAGLAVVESSGRLRLRTAVGWPTGLSVDPDPRRSQVALTLASGAPVVTEDLDREPRFSTDSLRAAGVASGMSVAVLGADERPFGVLSMHSTERRAFSGDDVAFLTSVAHVLTGAIRQDAASRDLRHQSLHDPLTHLPNRALLLDRLRHGLARARRDGSTLAVLFCDMDDFKYVNDSLGHAAGDRLLAALAPRLQSALRVSDTLARFGGDEFVVLCEGLHDPAEAVFVADRLLEACATPIDLGGTEIVPTVSIGIALAPPDADGDPDELLRDADVAMYGAKSGGKGRHELFDARMRAETLERLSLIADLRRAIPAGELELVYQPLVSLRQRAVVGVEALVRWRHPERGLLAPDAFIGLAEDNGLIADLGRWVVGQAVRQAARWRQAGTPVLCDVVVGVNVSWREIAHGMLAEDVRTALDRHGLDPSALCIEVTETALMGDPERSRATLAALHAMGVRLALDDFGTGQSSLSVLRDFTLDVIKLDRAFLAGEGGWPIVRAVCEMARSLDLLVVAEGVEVLDQAEQAREMGADFGQGWLYARPLGVEGMEEAMLELSGALRRGDVSAVAPA